MGEESPREKTRRYSFIYPTDITHWLSLPGTILGAGDATVNKRVPNLCLYRAYVSGKGNHAIFRVLREISMIRTKV